MAKQPCSSKQDEFNNQTITHENETKEEEKLNEQANKNTLLYDNKNEGKSNFSSFLLTKPEYKC